jgi:tetratricopeptide (TPR) repeat protein/S1-C subfamily serine protease
MKRSLYVVALTSSSALVLLLAACSSFLPSGSFAQSPAASTPQPSIEQVRQIAKTITVKVYAGDSQGSGVLVAKTGQAYTVLTNAHVSDRGTSHRIQTPDGKVHPATVKAKGSSFEGNDVALLQFQSSESYALAEVEKVAKPARDAVVLGAGFPAAGQTLTLTEGKLTLNLAQPLVGGYQLGYTNPTQPGMSGGPLLNRNGKVIGVLGQGSNAILDTAYVFQNGDRPDPQTLKQMREVGFAVPIAVLSQLSESTVQSTASTPTPPQASKPVALTGVAAQVNQLAEKVTVRIDSRSSGNGSGVIIAQEGQTYFVLTAAHVFAKPDEYTIVTADGQKQTVNYATVKPLEGADAAIVSFTSPKAYSVATLANYYRKFGELGLVFTTGFPQASDPKTEPTRSFTAGTMVDEFSAARTVYESASMDTSSGYELVYSNYSQPGMSGGPVFDALGQVIGINTAAEAELTVNKAGKDVELHLGHSLGVPIRTVLGLINQTKLSPQRLKVETKAPPSISQSEIDTALKSAFVAQPPPANASELEWLNYGNQLGHVGRHAEAITAIDRAIQLKPNFYQAHYARGLALRNQKKPTEALASFEQAIKIDPKFFQAWREKASVLYYSLKQPSAGLEAIKQAIQTRPSDAFVHLEYGQMLSQAKRQSEAIAAYSESIKLKPSYPAYFLRSDSRLQIGVEDYQGALADADKAVALQPAYGWAYRHRGLVRNRLKDYKGAVVDLTKSLELMPFLVPVYFERGIVRTELEDYPGAVADFSKTIEQMPQNAKAYFRRGSLKAAKLNDFKGGVADFTKVIELEPKNAQAYFRRGFVRVEKLNDPKGAIQDFSKVIELEPKNIDAYLKRSAARTHMKDYPGALADLDKALDIDPSNTTARNLRAILSSQGKSSPGSASSSTQPQTGSPNTGKVETLVSRGLARNRAKDYKQAIVDFDQAIALQPTFVDAYLGRGTARSYSGDPQGAIADFTKVISLQPKHVLAHANRGHVRMDLKDFPGAIQDFTAVIEQDPKNADAHFRRGLARNNSKDAQGAIVDLTTAINLNPKRAEAYLVRGVAKQTLKDVAGAKADFDNAVGLNPDLASAVQKLRKPVP